MRRALATTLVLGPLLLSGGLCSSIAGAQDVSLTPSAGGTGGTSFSLSCEADEVLVGVSGRAGGLVDRVAAVCQRVGADGVPTGSRRTTASAGGNGGTAFSRTCQAGQVVSAIRGRAGSSVDQIWLGCRTLDAQGRTSGAVTWLPAAGGNGGTSFGPHPCADGRPAKAIQGKSGLWLDQIRLACAHPVLPAVTTVKSERCFGAVGAQCGPQQGLAGFCAAGRCPVNAGSWAHDECCWRNPNGLACHSGPFDYAAPDRHRNVCAAEWDKAVAHLAGGLNWYRQVDFSKPNTTGVVVHADYCAPGGTIIRAEDEMVCCSRRTPRALAPADASRVTAQGVKNPLDPNLRVCR
jgi:hypothetical protein